MHLSYRYKVVRQAQAWLDLKSKFNYIIVNATVEMYQKRHGQTWLDAFKKAGVVVVVRGLVVVMVALVGRSRIKVGVGAGLCV